MGRKKKTSIVLDFVSVTVRMEKVLVDELEDIKEALYSTRTAILNECVRFGLQALKERKPEVVELVRLNKQHKKDVHNILKDEK